MSRAMRKRVADQPAHPHSLISAFVVHCLDSVMSLVFVTKISSLMLASVAEQAGLSLTWSETPEDMFSHDEAHIHWWWFTFMCKVIGLVWANLTIILEFEDTSDLNKCTRTSIYASLTYHLECVLTSSFVPYWIHLLCTRRDNFRKYELFLFAWNLQHFIDHFASMPVV